MGLAFGPAGSIPLEQSYREACNTKQNMAGQITLHL